MIVSLALEIGNKFLRLVHAKPRSGIRDRGSLVGRNLLVL
jgi:hypothetical protein